MKKLFILCNVIGISICSLYSQTKTIKGRVIAEDLGNMPQVSIMINDTVEIGRTNMDGFFQINIPDSEKKIVFWYIAMEPATIELVDKCDIIEVVMMRSGTYDFMTLKRVERKEKKRFKKLPDIHKQAFEKGIFETEKACYIRVLETY
jgi:hypothetical protein